MSLNNVSLIGHLGTEPQLRKTDSGKFVTGFRLATSFTWPAEEEGKLNERTDWHNIVVWNEQAESAVATLRKGSQVLVHGSLRTRSYEKMHKNKKGTAHVKVTHFITEIVATNVQVLGTANGKGEALAA